jgi:hypothetical protein
MRPTAEGLNMVAGCTLTVSDGKTVATLALPGQYSSSSFALSADRAGGTFITDPGTTSRNALAAHHA